MKQLPGVPGVLRADEVAATVESIVAVQQPDGNIPWLPGGHTDPWNLVEAAMALDVGGRHAEATRAYEWLRSMQRDDGSWHAYTVGREIEDATLDTNFTGYVATGVWHHYLETTDVGFLDDFWPVVEHAVDYVLAFQRPSGEIAWRGDDPDDGALLAGSSSLHLSLRCAIAVAERLGRDRPDWELSLGALAIAIAHRPQVFLDKGRWSMDWYYPILGGVLRDDAAHMRVAARWEDFVVSGRGVRCVADRPWVTVAETCELAMALDAIGARERGREVFEWVQFLRSDAGEYWTGANFAGGEFGRQGELFPVEAPTWSSAAVVLAANALGGTGPAAGLFRGDGLPRGLTPEELIAAGETIEVHARDAR